MASGRTRPERPAVVVGLESNGLGVVRALAAGGVPCVGVAGPGWHPALWSRACRPVRLPAWTGEALVAGLIDLARQVRAPAPLPLLLTKDEAVLWVDAARDELGEFYAINLPPSDVVDLLMNKQRFQALAQERGWPVPRTWRIDSRAELDEALPAIGYPCILKPRVKNSAFRENCPKKAFKLAGADELRNAYDLVARWEPEVVIQEWIGGGDDRVAFCLGYCDRGGQPLALFAGRKLRQWPIDCGNTALCEPAPESWARPVTELTRAIWQATGQRGLGSVEFKMRPGTDEPVIMEPTVGRTNYQNEVAVLNGVDIPLIAYCDLVGLPPPAPAPPRRPVKLIDSAAEWKSARAYMQDGRLTREDRSHDRDGPKRDMIWRPDDPGPWLAQTSHRLLAPVRWLSRPIRRSLRGIKVKT
jgi:predicted ATP-grasp superfamily ATP-dependent carboligase